MIYIILIWMAILFSMSIDNEKKIKLLKQQLEELKEEYEEDNY